jgi:hypothetical protein
MLLNQIERLKEQYTDKYVVVQADRPDLARFQGAVGQVKTVNMSGRALVRFDANSDQGWYDIAIEHLRVVDKPPPKAVEKKAVSPKAKAASAKASVSPPGGESPKGP